MVGAHLVVEDEKNRSTRKMEDDFDFETVFPSAACLRKGMCSIIIPRCAGPCMDCLPTFSRWTMATWTRGNGWVNNFPSHPASGIYLPRIMCIYIYYIILYTTYMLVAILLKQCLQILKVLGLHGASWSTWRSGLKSDAKQTSNKWAAFKSLVKFYCSLLILCDLFQGMLPNSKVGKVTNPTIGG